VRRVSEPELSCLFRLHACLETKHSKLPKGKPPTAVDLEREVNSFMTDEKRPDSLRSTLEEVQRVGGTVRERLSMDMTRLIGQLAASGRVEEGIPFVEYPAILTSCLELLSAFSGMERENITRGPGWLFLSLGRRLERAMYMVRQLSELATPLDEDNWPLLELMLEVADSSMTYRQRYFTSLQPAPVLEVLMTDETNPRSLAFQLVHLADLYGKLPCHVPRDLRAIQRAMDVLKRVDLRKLNFPLPGGETNLNQSGLEQLDQTLQNLDELLPSWSNNVSSTYFSHARTFAITIGG